MDKVKYFPPILETERLILRPITMDDKSAIYKWVGDPEVSKYMRYSNYKSEDDVDGWINSLYNKESELDYGFVWKETNELIGSGGLYEEEENIWIMGYNIRRDMWGKGITTEALKKMIEYAREKYNIRGIRGHFAIDNVGSRRVMEKLGLIYLEEFEYTKFDGSKTFKAKTYQKIFE